MLGAITAGVAINRNRTDSSDHEKAGARPTPTTSPRTYGGANGNAFPADQDYRKEQNQTTAFEPKYAPADSSIEEILEVFSYNTSKMYTQRNERYLAIFTEDWQNGGYAQIIKNRINNFENYYDMTSKFVLVKDWGMVSKDVWRVHVDIYETLEGGAASGKTKRIPASLELVKKNLISLPDDIIIRSGDTANTTDGSWEVESRDAWVIRNAYNRQESSPSS